MTIGDALAIAAVWAGVIALGWLARKEAGVLAYIVFAVLAALLTSEVISE